MPTTGIYQGGCMNCEARAIAQGPEAKSREADPGAVQAVMRKVWPIEADYFKGRSLVWAWIKRLQAIKEPVQ
jgi:hypothetical protein